MKNVSVCNGCKYSKVCYDTDREKDCSGYEKKSLSDYISEIGEKFYIMMIYKTISVYNYGWRNETRLVSLYDGGDKEEIEKYKNSAVLKCRARIYKGETFYELYI